MDYNIIDNVLTSVDQVAYLSQRLPGQVRLSQFGFLSIDDFPKVKNISRNIWTLKLNYHNNYRLIYITYILYEIGDISFTNIESKSKSSVNGTERH